mmetsp:Transcript_23317/g.17746  ORF Transcript_23317/g.17746 Transcript_23317/m.17746 type:complete len:170 (+) Transcript_23317:404-913(+)
MDGQEIWLRSRLHATRSTSKKTCFLVLREQFATVQAVLFAGEQVSVGMVAYAKNIPKESIVEVRARVTIPQAEVTGCSQKVELQILEIWVVNKSAPMLPFQLEDASRKVENQALEDEEQKEEGKEDSKEASKEEAKQSVVKQDVRLNNRIIDLRVPANQALMKLQSAVC